MNHSKKQARILSRTHRKGVREGAFTVEFALCCGLFFMLLMAGIEFTRFMYARHSIDQAAYEAARIGIVPGKTPAMVADRANQILNATGVKWSPYPRLPSTTKRLKSPFASRRTIRTVLG
jgi:Flp pilus assembly protein TadG